MGMGYYGKYLEWYIFGMITIWNDKYFEKKILEWQIFWMTNIWNDKYLEWCLFGMTIDIFDDKINFMKYFFCLEVTPITLILPLGHKKSIGTLGYPIASKLKNYRMHTIITCSWLKNHYLILTIPEDIIFQKTSK